MALIWRTSFSLFIFFAAVVVLFWYFQRSLLYHPAPHKPNINHYKDTGLTEIPIVTNDGLKLYAWYRAPTTKKMTVVMFHGNAGDLAKRIPFARGLISQGFGVMLMSYRGYGGNPGKPTELGLYKDARAAMHFLKKEKSCVVIYGESLGSGVATKMGEEFHSCGVILQSPFLSIVSMARERYPFLSFIEPDDKYHSDKRINKIKAPLLIIHGTADGIVPYVQGKALFDLREKKKTFWTYPGLGHGNLWSQAYYQRLARYLESLSGCCKGTALNSV